MNVLIIGDADSIWVKTIVEKTYLPFGDQVSILSGRNTLFSEYYHKNNVAIFILKKARQFPRALNLLHNIRVVCRNYDLVVVHYVASHKALLAKIGSYFSKKTLLVFWGSDLLRINRKNRIVESAIKSSSSVLLSTDEMFIRFRMYYGKYEAKVKRINFGSNGIDVLNKHEYNQEMLSQKYGIDHNKVVIAIGYNKMRAQQHIKVLQIIDELPDEAKRKIHVLLRLTYGDGDDAYVESIKKLLEQTKCTGTIIESFMTDEECSELTFLTDMFIHAQISDARSASMCEHLYAGSLVLNPSWITYRELEDKVFYLAFSDFSELKQIIMQNLSKKDDSIYWEKLKRNQSIIYDICSWETNIEMWRKCYLQNS